MTTRKITTAYDVRRAKYDAEARVEHARAVKVARAKVRIWKRKVEWFGGDVHKATLAKFQAQLAELLR